MTASFSKWIDEAGQPMPKLIDAIVTGKTLDTIYHNEEVMGAVAGDWRVLDFGCGVGRNLLHFARRLPGIQFVGFDSEAMLSRVGEYATSKYSCGLDSFPNVTLRSDWGNLSREKFGSIYATLVLQHISEEDIRSYIADFRKMSGRLVLCSRRHLDDGTKNIWRVLESCGLHASNATQLGLTFDGDLHDHHSPVLFNLDDNTGPYGEGEAAEARIWVGRNGPSNSWTATNGTAARMIGRLLKERERLTDKIRELSLREEEGQ